VADQALVKEGRIYVRPVGRGVVFEDDDLYLDEAIEELVGGSNRYADVRITVEIVAGPWAAGEEPGRADA
jgi:hypothetical protein